MKPALLIGIDTEADDQWTLEGRRRLEVRNAERLPALQARLQAMGIPPTYLVTHEMATRPESASILRDLARGGRCEIGTHLHPWSSPPFRPEDLDGHTYPHQLPTDVLDRQLTELTQIIESEIGVRPTTYRAGRNGFDGRSLKVLERLGYTVDTSVDPLFNETRKGGRVFAGAPVAPYFPDVDDVCRPGGSRVLEVPISSATDPALPKSLEAAYTRMPPLPYRGWLKRLGLRAVWLRPSYTPLEPMKRLAARLVARGVPCLNVIFHSSELLPGGSPYNRDEAAVTRFLDDLQGFLDYARTKLGAEGRTFAALRAGWPA